MTSWVYGARKMLKPSRRPLKKDASKFIRLTGNKFALDTNIVSAWLKGEISIADKIDGAESIFLAMIVIGGLYYGAGFSSQVAKNTQDIEKITSRYQLLSLDGNRISSTFLYNSISIRLILN
jgi:hypothetical protein